MKSNYKKLGKYIEVVNIRNKDLKVEKLLGVSIKKVLMPSIANTVGTNMKTYKIIQRNQFAYGPVTSRNGDKISVALLEEFDKAIISQAYTVFKVLDETELIPEYLMMWFRRPEFDRYARFMSHGSARETFDWDEMEEVELPIPSIEKQRAIVKEYNTVVNRIKLNETLNQKLEETAQAIYKHWFVDFEFPVHLASSPPLKEECPKGEVVNNLNNLPYLKTFRKQLRNNLTPAEAKLWTYLKNKQLEGRKFRRQHSFGNYILDFYCPSENIAIELDGEGHNKPSQAEYDHERDMFLQQFGIKVLRFENKIVFENPESLFQAVKDEFGWKKNHPAFQAPLLKKEGNLGKGYKSSGGAMVFNEELGKEIPEGWEYKRLNEIGEVIDSLHKTPKYSQVGYPMVRVTDINAGFLNLSNTMVVDQAVFNDFSKNHKSHKGDIVVSRVGATYGEFSYAHSDKKFCLGQNTAVIITKILDSKLTYTALVSSQMRRQIEKQVAGSAYSTLSLKDIRELKICIPSIDSKSVINPIVSMLEVIFEKRSLCCKETLLLRNWAEINLAKMTKIETIKKVMA